MGSMPGSTSSGCTIPRITVCVPHSTPEPACTSTITPTSGLTRARKPGGPNHRTCNTARRTIFRPSRRLRLAPAWILPGILATASSTPTGDRSRRSATERCSTGFSAAIRAGRDSRWTCEPTAGCRAAVVTGSRLWMFADLVVNGVAPYLDLPGTGLDTYGRSARGYSEGQFRGERLAYGEIEYRASLTRNGLLGMVVFLNTTTVSNQQDGERLFDSFAPAGGAGLRLLINKRSKTNLCFDLGVGKQGSTGVYLAIQEAF